MNKKIMSLVNDMISEDGLHDTKIPAVKLYKTTTPIQKCPNLYDNLLIIVLQGRKIVKTAKESIEYNPKKYLVVPTTLPLEVETLATKEEPLISLVIKLDKKIFFEIFDRLNVTEQSIEQSYDLALFTDTVTQDIEDIVFRLIKSLQSRNDSNILGEVLLKELFYRVVQGDKSMFLQKLFLNTTVEAKISRTLRRIHEQYNKSLDVKTLSRLEDMSSSSFHTHFKNITSYTPGQYIRNLRLTQANKLLGNYNYQVNKVAHEIGYESIPQFSHDYKAYFGFTPKDTPKNQREIY